MSNPSGACWTVIQQKAMPNLCRPRYCLPTNCWTAAEQKAEGNCKTG